MSRIPPELKSEILEVYDASRGRLPPVSDVAARPNVRRLASVSRRARGKAVLNLSTAVVGAGKEAWELVAPALEGHRESLRRIRELTRDGVEANRSRMRSDGAGPSANGRRTRASLPDTPCDGDSEQRRYLDHLIAYVRETSGYPEALPTDTQIRISRRMTRALGSCICRGGSRRITIAERLFRRGLEDVLWDTVRHELAHLADRTTAAPDRGGPPHGPGWKEWALRLGARPERLCTPAEGRRIEALRSDRRALPRYPVEVARWLEKGR